MADNVENLILEHLSAIRADLADVRATLQDHGAVSQLEFQLGAIPGHLPIGGTVYFSTCNARAGMRPASDKTRV
jgi:hypothetical protein